MRGLRDGRAIVVNGSFRDQRVTGQQRYAREIADRLPYRELRPPRALDGRPILTWLWCIVVLPVLSRRSLLLTLTSRGPLLARRQVVVVHDLFVLEHPEWFSRRYYWTHRWTLELQLRTAHALICVSEETASRVRARYPLKRVVVAPNGVTRRLITGQARRSTTGHVLAVGSLDPRKNLGRLISAHAQLPDHTRREHELVIVGGTASAFPASELPATGHVRFAGTVSDEELAELYASAAVVVVPSLDEGFGLPLIEGICLNGNVVASDIAVFRDVAGDRVGYFDPMDIDDIAREILASLTRPRHPDHSILSEYDWNRSAAMVETFLTEVDGTTEVAR